MTQSVPAPRYDVARKGMTLGSYLLTEIPAEITSGKLLWSDDCWTEGMESWGKLDDLRDQLEASSTAANPTNRSRLPLYAGIAGLSLLLIGAAAYLLTSAAPTEITAEVPAAPTAIAAAPAMGGQAKSLQRSLSEVQETISMLAASSFQTDKSETGVMTYTHRYYHRVGNRIPLRVEIDAGGRCHFVTFYQGKHWIFHRQLRFIVGQQTLETTVIDAHKRGRTIGEDNSVNKSCRFESPDDVKLVGRLAAAADLPVTFQMVGLKPFDSSLSYETKVAIRESYQFGELLAKRRQLLTDLGIRP